MPAADVSLNIDLTNEKLITENVHQILRKYGAIDILINNIHVIGVGLLEATPVSQIQETLNTSLFGVIRIIQSVLPNMRKNKCGVILNICCGPSVFSPPFLTTQTLTNTSIVALTEALQFELKEEGIDCISVFVDSCLPRSINNKPLTNEFYEIAKSYAKSKRVIQKLKRSMSQCEALGGKVQQQVADDILRVLNIRNGSRPKQIIIDRQNEEVIDRILETKLKLTDNWLKKTGLKNTIF